MCSLLPGNDIVVNSLKLNMFTDWKTVFHMETNRMLHKAQAYIIFLILRVRLLFRLINHSVTQLGSVSQSLPHLKLRLGYMKTILRLGPVI